MSKTAHPTSRMFKFEEDALLHDIQAWFRGCDISHMIVDTEVREIVSIAVYFLGDTRKIIAKAKDSVLGVDMKAVLTSKGKPTGKMWAYRLGRSTCGKSNLEPEEQASIGLERIAYNRAHD